MSGKWVLCNVCEQIMFTGSTKKHKCPALVRELRELAIEEEAHEIMFDFNKELDKFWKDSRTKYYRYLAENGEI